MQHSMPAMQAVAVMFDASGILKRGIRKDLKLGSLQPINLKLTSEEIICTIST